MSNDQRASVFRWSEVARNWAVVLGPVLGFFALLWLKSEFVTISKYDAQQLVLQKLSESVILLTERQLHDAAQDNRMDRFEAQLRELQNRRIVGEPYSNSK